MFAQSFPKNRKHVTLLLAVGVPISARRKWVNPRSAPMREAEKIVFHDRDVPAIVNPLMRAAILFTLFAIAARGAFAIPAFGVALIMLAALRPSRLVLRRAGGEMRARLARPAAARDQGDDRATPRPRAGPIWRRCTQMPLRLVA
jgi:hypothetical protein